MCIGDVYFKDARLRVCKNAVRVQCGRTAALDSCATISHQMKPDDEREKESTSGFQPTVNTHTHTHTKNTCLFCQSASRWLLLLALGFV